MLLTASNSFARMGTTRSSQSAWWRLVAPAVAILIPLVSVPELQSQQVRPSVVEALPLALEYGHISWVSEAPRGKTVIVVDPMDREARVVVRDITGRLQVIGRQGDGPGEYRSLERVLVRGDSVEIFDRLRRQVTTLNLDSGRGTTRTATVASPAPQCRWSYEIAALAALCVESTQDEATRSEKQTHYRRVAPASRRDTASLVTLTSIEHDPARVVMSPSGNVVLNHWYGWKPRVAISPDGNTVAVLSQTRQGSRAEVVLTMYKLGTGQRTIWRNVLPVVPVSQRERRAFVEAEVANLRSEAAMIGRDPAKVAVAEIERALALPDAFPPFTHFQVGNEGCTWFKVARPVPPRTAGARWDVYTATGRLLHAASVPGRLALMGVTCTLGHAVAFHPDGSQTPVRVVLRGP